MTGKVEPDSPPDGGAVSGRAAHRRGAWARCTSPSSICREVALKILSPSPDMEESGAFEERFRLEAETLAALNHPNIVTLYDYGQTDDGRYFLALEYIDGPRFTDILRAGPMAAADAVRLILQVCRALRYAHRRGVVHRDLKPSNLLTYRDDEGEEHVKVVGFGLVKVLEDDQSLTRAGLILGSPHCMAPEQIRGDEIDHRADIYAIGVLLFRAVTATWPFHGDTSTGTMIAHINNPVPRFRDLQLPFEVSLLEDVIRRCLSKNAADRYADVGTLMTKRRAIGVDASLTLTSASQLSGSATLAERRQLRKPDPTGLEEPTEASGPSFQSSAITSPLPDVTRSDAAQRAAPEGNNAVKIGLLLLLVLISAGGGVVLTRLLSGDAGVKVDAAAVQEADIGAPSAGVAAPPDAPEAGAAEDASAPPWLRRRDRLRRGGCAGLGPTGAAEGHGAPARRRPRPSRAEAARPRGRAARRPTRLGPTDAPAAEGGPVARGAQGRRAKVNSDAPGGEAARTGGPSWVATGLAAGGRSRDPGAGSSGPRRSVMGVRSAIPSRACR